MRLEKSVHYKEVFTHKGVHYEVSLYAASVMKCIFITSFGLISIMHHLEENSVKKILCSSSHILKLSSCRPMLSARETPHPPDHPYLRSFYLNLTLRTLGVPAPYMHILLLLLHLPVLRARIAETSDSGNFLHSPPSLPLPLVY